MSGPTKSALPANPNGATLPPVPLTIDAQYQFCVDAGASAALEFLDDLAEVGLHDHIACASHLFSSSVRAAMAAAGDWHSTTMQRCIDAFAAGYLGRIQQELQIFKRDAQAPLGANRESHRQRCTH